VKPTFPFPDYKVIQLAKAPLPGRVKTRMSKVLSDDDCVGLHEYLCREVCAIVQGAALCPHLLLAGEPSGHSFFHALQKTFGLTLGKQSSGDLGARMSQAVTEAFAAQTPCQGVILIGSDCPFLSKDYLHQAISALEKGAPAVMGPAIDGGYVLLGLGRDLPDVFRDIDWGTAVVKAQTLSRFDELNLEPALLAAMSDVDEAEDLPALLSQSPRQAMPEALRSTLTRCCPPV